jgi:16S rRNA (cytosine967-C5)-methyltransferase
MQDRNQRNSHQSNGNVSGTKGLNARLTAANILTQIIDYKASLDDVADIRKGSVEFKKLDNRDQSLAKAIVLTTLRNKTRIDAVLKHSWNRKPPQKARFLIHILETAAAQILFMDIPESAAVNLAVTAIRNDKRTTRFASFTNAVLRNLVREKAQSLEKSKSLTLFPDWMQKTLTRDFGPEKTAQMSVAIAMEPTLDLNGKSKLNFENLEVIDLPGGGKRLVSPLPVHELPGFDAGDWWIQDIAAAQPVRLLKDIKGKKVADLCAAPGGKTMQLAALGADVTAVDISKRRLERLQENLDRTGLKAKLVQADITIFEPEELFDAIILDAPCTASGTMRRHPDILWNTTQQDILELAELQKTLIQKAVSWLKPGGILVYANCSVFKDEGENLIAKLHIEDVVRDPISPEELPDLEFCINGQGAFRSLPHFLELDPKEKSGMDGFFAARFIKKS